MELKKIVQVIGIFGFVGALIAAVSIWVSENSESVIGPHPGLKNLGIFFQVLFCPATLLPLGDLLDNEGRRISQGFITPVLINLILYLIVGTTIALGLYWKRFFLYSGLSIIGLYWFACLIASIKFF